MSTLSSMSKPLELPIKYSTASPSLRRLARNQYISKQKGLCAHCNTPLSVIPQHLIDEFPINLALFPNGMLDYPVHLHHCHETDLTIGAVHSYCNAVLWQYFNE